MLAGSPSPSPDDFELMRRIADGDAGALTKLYEKFSPTVFAIGLRILRDRQEAEDLLIDVFWEMWDRAGRYDPFRGAPLTYILNLSRSRAIDRRRSRAYQERFRNEVENPSSMSGEPDPSEESDLAEQRQRVRQALACLDPVQREAVELAYFEALSHTQIAERLNKPLGTIKTYIRQGLIRLRDGFRTDT
ncbi:MAG: sigma-70 family RNA polymerase sigma factor [Tepidisphaeraceae bacterium]